MAYCHLKHIAIDLLRVAEVSECVAQCRKIRKWLMNFFLKT